MKTFFKIELGKMTTPDEYENGEVGPFQDYGIFHTEKVDSIAAALRVFQEYFLDTVKLDDVSIYDDRIEWCRHENPAGEPPRQWEIDLWKKGDQAMYSVTYTMWITRVIEQPQNNTHLSEALPFLTNHGV